jgi:hypothetical protein
VLYVAQSRRFRGWVAALRRERRRPVSKVVAT